MHLWYNSIYNDVFTSRQVYLGSGYWSRHNPTDELPRLGGVVLFLLTDLKAPFENSSVALGWYQYPNQSRPDERKKRQ